MALTLGHRPMAGIKLRQSSLSLGSVHALTLSGCGLAALEWVRSVERLFFVQVVKGGQEWQLIVWG